MIISKKYLISILAVFEVVQIVLNQILNVVK